MRPVNDGVLGLVKAFWIGVLTTSLLFRIRRHTKEEISRTEAGPKSSHDHSDRYLSMA